MLLLDHVGAKTGIKRTTPLVYVEDHPDVVLVASKGGHPNHPAWYHNLRANPATTAQLGTEHRAVRARVATPEERRRLWPKALATYSGYARLPATHRARDPALDPRAALVGSRALNPKPPFHNCACAIRGMKMLRGGSVRL